MDNIKTLIGTRIEEKEIKDIQKVLEDHNYVGNLINSKGTQIGEDEIKYTANISYDMNVTFWMTGRCSLRT